MSWNLDNPTPGETVFLFDVDGTLTPAREEIDPSFTQFFISWAKDKDVYLVSGSDLSKLREQLPDTIFAATKGVFTCCGNEHYTKWGDLVYSNQYEPSRELILYLNEKLNLDSKYKKRFGNHIEVRPGMLNFSVVGRNATAAGRKEYYKWDISNKERNKIAKEIEDKFPTLQASVGGQISIDIYPKGKDKSQILEHLNYSKYIFLGDRLQPGGNDFPLAKALNKKQNFVTHNVLGYEDTWQILQGLYSEKICENENCGGCGCVEYQ